MAAALFTTLQADDFPTDDRTSKIFSMLENSTRDGYVLLWHMFTLVVPVFNPSHRVDVPDWFEENQCVFQFAQAFLLYFRCNISKRNWLLFVIRASSFSVVLQPIMLWLPAC